jgi:hypothetical protein
MAHSILSYRYRYIFSYGTGILLPTGIAYLCVTILANKRNFAARWSCGLVETWEGDKNIKGYKPVLRSRIIFVRLRLLRLRLWLPSYYIVSKLL